MKPASKVNGNFGKYSNIGVDWAKNAVALSFDESTTSCPICNNMPQFRPLILPHANL